MGRYPDNAIVYSVSSLKDQALCPARLHFKKMVRLKQAEEDMNYPTVYGSAVHLAIEKRLKQETDDGKKVAYEYVQENLLDKFDPKLFDHKEIESRNEQLERCIDNFEREFYVPVLEQIDDPEHSVEVGLEIPWRKGFLVGKVDVILPDNWADWKSGMRVPSDTDLINDQQSLIYYYMAYKTGIPTPKAFNYVYLHGTNVAKKIETLKSGPNKGKERYVPDDDNPIWKYTYPVYPNDQRVNNMLRNWAIPLARSMETGIVYKNKSAYNCKSCRYRTVCSQTDLPEATPGEHLDLIQELQINEPHLQQLPNNDLVGAEGTVESTVLGTSE